MENVNNFSGKFGTMKDGFISPHTSQNTLYQTRKQNDSIRDKKSTYKQFNDPTATYINSIPSNENSNKKEKYNNNIYINNYKPRKRKFHVVRNDSNNDILKYFSKNYQKKSKHKNNNILLTDFDSNNSNVNNIIYLVKEGNNDNENNLFFNRNQFRAFKNNNQNIKKSFLPFCVYNNNIGVPNKNNNMCDIKNCPGCIYCSGIKENEKNNTENDYAIENNIENENDDNDKEEDNIIEEEKLNNSNSIRSESVGTFRNNFYEAENEGEKLDKKNILNEDERGKEEKISETIEESIESELHQRGRIFVHCFVNRIMLSRDFRTNNLRKRRNKNRKKINLSWDGIKKKENSTELQYKKNISNSDKNRNSNNNNKKKVRSAPKAPRYPNGLIKSKKVELLRE